MKNIINFIKYHNLFTIILGLVLLLTAGAFASEDIREAVIGKEIITANGIDNSQLLTTDLDNFDMAFQIINVSEDEKNYYVDYTYNTIAIVNNTWRIIIKEKTLTVSKKALDEEDLGLYVAEELGEVADYELAYLKEVQGAEREKGIQKLVASVEYTGLRGLVLDIRNKILPGYEPVVQPELPALVESDNNSGGDTTGQPVATAEPISRPETFLDSFPEPLTTSLKATFVFRSSKENSFFQCKVNNMDWRICSSPKTYPGLVPGDYTFQVFATDSRGRYDKTPAVFSWTIIRENFQFPISNFQTNSNDQSSNTEEISASVESISTSTEPIAATGSPAVEEPPAEEATTSEEILTKESKPEIISTSTEQAVLNENEDVSEEISIEISTSTNPEYE
jgi:hypothetical protein